jgi:D-3-phosphoglycerate dehydrogenase / 2-oxoglutarate reductase
MSELTFGEKLLIARKQLDLYQYEMAEKLGVHPNSLTKYERGEGKPHAAVVRMFDLFCEQQGIRFEAYENASAAADRGAAMKIVLAEKVSPATLAVFAAEPGWEVTTHDQLPDGLPAALKDADALVVRSAVQVDDALMEHAAKLRVIGRAGVGVDNIDAEAATRRGIVVMNTPGANAVAVAELAIGLMIALARKLPAANSTMHAGKWEKKNLQGGELRGKTLGILGLGRIGLEVARRARGFGMELIGSDPFVSAAVARENGVSLVSIEDLFARSDYLTLHVGLTPQTNGIVNAKTLATMKKGVRLINCARGELVVEADLVAALKSGQAAGAALDVFTIEPPRESPYFGLDNVILTPHIAGSTGEAQEAVGVQIAQQVREYLKLGVVQNAVNLPSLSHEEYVKLAPYIDLAGRLGAFLAQAGKSGTQPQPNKSEFAGGSGLESIHIIYAGALAEGKTELIRNAAIAGLLQGFENVNRINAAAIAQERGIRIHEEKEESHRGGAAAVLTLVLHTAQGESRASATVIHGEQPRLLAFDGIDVEAPLEGTLVFCRNLDVPGVIGRIGTILGQQGVNIANFALGRERLGTQHNGKMATALAVVQVDEPVSEQVLEALKVIDALLEAKLVKLPDGR